jgi:hypothetical protein
MLEGYLQDRKEPLGFVMAIELGCICDRKQYMIDKVPFSLTTECMLLYINTLRQHSSEGLVRFSEVAEEPTYLCWLPVLESSC